jgi:hypothetical protein
MWDEHQERAKFQKSNHPPVQIFPCFVDLTGGELPTATTPALAKTSAAPRACRANA